MTLAQTTIAFFIPLFRRYGRWHFDRRLLSRHCTTYLRRNLAACLVILGLHHLLLLCGYGLVPQILLMLVASVFGAGMAFSLSAYAQAD